MIRKFNYTGRQRIARNLVSIERTDVEDGWPHFNATIDLSSLSLPGTAKVYVEAYRGPSFMRFDFGTVESIRPPADRQLRRLEHRGSAARFRVKVVNEESGDGIILAAADRIVPGDSSDHASILPVDFIPLGNLPWKMEFEDDGPVLQVTNQISDLVTSSQFVALVLPQVLGAILNRMYLDPDVHVDPDDLDNWPARWLRFVANFHSTPPPLAAETESWGGWIEANRLEVDSWIEGSVRSFADQIEASRILREALEEA